MGVKMDGMVLIADGVATNRILLKALFSDAGYVPLVVSLLDDCFQMALAK